MKIRVLHIIDQYKIGGPGKTILNSARFIDKQRYEIHIGAFVPDLSVGTELSRKVEDEKIPHVFLPDVRGLSIRNILRLRSYIRKNRIDIYHCHGYKSEIYAHLLKVFYGSPVFVATYHGWITNSMSMKFKVKATQLFSFLLDGIIAVAEDVYAKLPMSAKTFTQCRVIHNAIVIEDYTEDNCRKEVRSQNGIDDGEFVVGVIGRMSPEKGGYEAIDAISYLNRIGIKVRLMMVGDGPLKNELESYAMKQKLSAMVIFTGHVHPVRNLYAALDMVVSPSYTEGISNVILEAMTLRKPVVATAIGGTPEIIQNGINGMLVPSRDAKTIGDAIATLIQKPDLVTGLTKAGYSTIIEHFEFSKRMLKVESFYENVQARSAHTTDSLK